MSITNYSELVDAITGWMNDASLSAYAPDFIAMAEASFNRRLANLEMEGTATIAAAASVSLPTDFISIKTLYLDTDPRKLLEPMSEGDLRRYWAAQTTGEPASYALASESILLGPAPDTTYTLSMTYLRKLTPLSASNITNWLLEAHPDLYLYASLLHGEFRGWNDDRLPMIGNAVDTIISEINMAGNRRRTASGMRMRSVQERI